MTSISFILLLLYFAFPSISADEYSDFRMRKKFHEIICERHPNLSTCNGPFTIQDYRQELSQRGAEEQNTNDDSTTASSNFQVSRRSDFVDDDLDDRDYEYYMWRKRRRQMLRRKMAQYDRESDPEYHYHFHEAPRYNYRPYYPRYSSYYPSYGSYGGYGNGYGGYGGGGYGGYGGGFGGGGLLGGLFGIGVGRSIGISTPIGGFGYQSGFGIGIG